jgi:hypothetical protein
LGAEGAVLERPLTPWLSLIDIHKALLWHRDGRVSLVYAIDALHEPGLAEEDFNKHAQLAEHVFSGLPEDTTWQFFVIVDHDDGLKYLEERFPPIAGRSSEDQLFEEFRQAKMRDLARVEVDASGTKLVQLRRHHVVVSFLPSVCDVPLLRRAALRLRSLLGRDEEAAEASWGKYGESYKRILREASQMDQRVTVGLLQMGLGVKRAATGEMVRLMYEMLNPTLSRLVLVESLSQRARFERDGLPRAIVEELPWAGDTSPVWSLLGDELLVRRDYLEVGDYYATIVSVRELPDKTTPGCLVPLLHLGRRRYIVSYRVEIPKQSREMAALRAKATLAEGLKFQNLFVETTRTDALAQAVQKQTDDVLERVISSTQRVCGISLQVMVYEKSAEDLEEAVQQVLGALSRAHGMRGTRERFLLKRAYLAFLPGAPPLVQRARKAPSDNVADMLPYYDFRLGDGDGKIAFLTPQNSVVLFDPWARGRANAHISISGETGAGKSFLAQRIIVDYEVGCRSRGEAPPYVFILDNGASYRRLMELRGPTGRYVTFSFDRPPGVPIFEWCPEDGSLDDHVSRLEWLLLDLLKVSPSNEERFERMKVCVEQALYRMYREGLDRDFKSFAALLEEAKVSEDLRGLLPSFTEGKFAKLFERNPDLELSRGVQAVCYDFKNLEAHRDLGLHALRLVIYQVRRWAGRMARQNRRTILLVDENWQFMDTGGTGAIGEQGALFLSQSIRQGRKENMACLFLSQSYRDWAASSYGLAIIGNTATKFLGSCAPAEVKEVNKHLKLSPRQVDMLERLTKTERYHEFLMIQGQGEEGTAVVRVPADEFSRWVFTTDPRDKARLAELEAAYAEMSLLERIRLVAGGG